MNRVIAMVHLRWYHTMFSYIVAEEVKALGFHSVFENDSKSLILQVSFISQLFEISGSGTLYLCTLQLWMLHLRKLELWSFSFWTLHLREVTPSGSYTFGKLHLREVTPSDNFTFGILHLRKLNLQMFHLRNITPSGHYTFVKLHLPGFHSF